MGRALVAWLALLMPVFITGCGTQHANKENSSNDSELQPAISVVENGPVKLTAEVLPTKARLSDEPVLTLTIDSESGVEIEKPPFGDALGSFKIIDSREPLPKTREGREIVQQVITLEPTETGKQTIDPISVTFRDKRPGADGKPQSLATKRLTVEVTSSYAKETPSLGDLHDAAGPVALPWRTPIWVWAIFAAAFACAMIAIMIWHRRQREKAITEIVLTPEELARIELQKLVESGWMETDVKLYFVELTAIVRRYIERTTGIRAPEQTTEEFLREISHNKSLFNVKANTSSTTAGFSTVAELPMNTDTARQGNGGTPIFLAGLKDFLESADLVKFAAYHPRREDIEESFHRAEVFIGLKTRGSAPSSKEAVA